MSIQKLRMIGILIWGGAVLLIVGILLNYPALKPYLNAILETPENVVAVSAPTPTSRFPIQPTATPPLPTAESPEVLAASEQITTATGETMYFDTVEVAGTPTPEWPGVAPKHVSIPDIQLNAPIVPITWKTTTIDGFEQAMWDVPDWRAAGWHETSANIGVPGNTVLNGHNTTKGEVFRDLYLLEPGALIMVQAEDNITYTYTVTDVLILPEAGQPLEVRMENARYIQPTQDERLTLVTCHPYGSLANRLLVIAYPAGDTPRHAQQGD